MIYIKEKFSEDGEVTIQIEGSLDSKSLTSLREVCAVYLCQKKLRLNLEKVDRVDRESLDYLRSIRKHIHLDGLNNYLILELNDT